MNLENIPTYLKDYGSWCNWKYEKRKSGMTKVPYNPKTGNYVSVKNPDTFTDFSAVVAVIDNYNGIGIRVDGKIIAIDLDHCIKEEKIERWASEIVSRFRNTYIEKSPSGEGLRILLFGADGYTYDKIPTTSKREILRFMYPVLRIVLSQLQETHTSKMKLWRIWMLLDGF